MSTLHKLLIFTVLVGLATTAAAEDSGFYLGGSVGYVDYDEDKGDVNAALALAGVTGTVLVDDEDLGWKSFWGYNFNKYMAIEGAYVDLGEVDGDFTVTAPLPGAGKSVVEVDGFTVLGIGQYPVLEQLDIFAKVGAYFWDAEGRITLNSGASQAAFETDEDGTDLVYGAGAAWNFTEHLTVPAEWERYSDVGDDDNDVDFLSIGIEFNF